MPRYPLILKDKTYMALYKEAAAKGISLGKHLNQILDKHALSLDEEQDTLNPHCMTCQDYNQKTGWCPVRQTKTGPMNKCKSYRRG